MSKQRPFGPPFNESARTAKKAERKEIVRRQSEAAARKEYQVNRPTFQEHLDIVLQCLAHFDLHLEQRIEDAYPKDARYATTRHAGELVRESTKRAIRDYRLDRSQDDDNRSRRRGTCLHDIWWWVREQTTPDGRSWAGVPKKAIKSALEEHIDQGRARATDDDWFVLTPEGRQKASAEQDDDAEVAASASVPEVATPRKANDTGKKATGTKDQKRKRPQQPGALTDREQDIWLLGERHRTPGKRPNFSAMAREWVATGKRGSRQAITAAWDSADRKIAAMKDQRATDGTSSGESIRSARALATDKRGQPIDITNDD